MQFDATTYGLHIAADYDDLFALSDTKDAVEFLYAQAPAADRFLEFGVGTGRVALALAERGMTGVGLDTSPEMLDILARKAAESGLSVEAKLADCTKVTLDKSFDLIYAIFNTIFCLLDQEQQIDAFRNAARHLSPSGRFVIEVFVPDISWLANAHHVRSGRIETGVVSMHVGEHDPFQQTMSSQLVVLRNGEPPRLFPIRMRYTWPAELDLIARLAGLSRVGRYADWDGSEFGADSGRQICVYELAR